MGVVKCLLGAGSGSAEIVAEVGVAIPSLAGSLLLRVLLLPGADGSLLVLKSPWPSLLVCGGSYFWDHFLVPLFCDFCELPVYIGQECMEVPACYRCMAGTNPPFMPAATHIISASPWAAHSEPLGRCALHQDRVSHSWRC